MVGGVWRNVQEKLEREDKEDGDNRDEGGGIKGRKGEDDVK